MERVNNMSAGPWRGYRDYPTYDDDDDPEENNDESPFEKTYVAIDGVLADDLSTQEKEKMEKEIIDLMILDLQVPITDVRVIDDPDTAVMEVDNK